IEQNRHGSMASPHDWRYRTALYPGIETRKQAKPGLHVLGNVTSTARRAWGQSQVTHREADQEEPCGLAYGSSGHQHVTPCFKLATRALATICHPLREELRFRRISQWNTPIAARAAQEPRVADPALTSLISFLPRRITMQR